MSKGYHLAVDLGAESGRVLLGLLEAGKLEMREIYRFPNMIDARADGLFWNLAALEDQILLGLDEVERLNIPIASLSTDSWGVDYVLLGANGNLITEPRCYRDARNSASLPRVLKTISHADLYAETGIRPLAINTICQLEAENHDDTGRLSTADHFLLIADYFNSRFSGISVTEQSIASTTQLYDPRSGGWSKKVIPRLGFPDSLFRPIVPSGTELGWVGDMLGCYKTLSEARVIATCSHDTAAAIAAAPASSGESWAFLSSGTWSLLGAETPSPVMTEAACEAGFNNEVGLGGTIQLLKNIVGLWIVQECCRSWQAAGKSYSYDNLTEMAEAAGVARAHINVEDPRFLSPGGMPEKVATFCLETRQPAPESPGEIVRIVLESLALYYARTLEQLKKLTGVAYGILHLVGGGSRNHLLNQLTASATGIQVMAGPAEATAIGNLLIQALALGRIQSATDLRSVVAASFPARLFEPDDYFPQSTRIRFSELFT